MSLRRTSVISEVAVSRDWGRIEGWPVTAGWKWHLISWGGCRGAGRTGREDGGGGGVAISSPLFIRGEGQFLFSQVSSGNLWGLYWAYKYSQIHRPWSEIRSVKYLVLSLTERNLEYMQSQFNEFISDWCGLVLLFPLGGGGRVGELFLCLLFGWRNSVYRCEDRQELSYPQHCLYFYEKHLQMRTMRNDHELRINI